MFKVWTLWEESQSWLENLLQGLEHRLTSMHSEEQAEEALQRSLSAYEVCRVSELKCNDSFLHCNYDINITRSEFIMHDVTQNIGKH